MRSRFTKRLRVLNRDAPFANKPLVLLTCPKNYPPRSRCIRWISFNNPRSRSGAPEGIRTPGLCLRRAALYPAELRVLPNGAILADVGVTRQAPCRPPVSPSDDTGAHKAWPQGELRL